MNIISRIAIAILLLSPIGASAQQALESALKAVENSKSLTNEIYSERRNPDTGAIEKASYAFEFTDNKLADKVIYAIRHERDRASSYELVNRHNKDNNVVYTITFETSKSCAQYTLIHRGQSKWMFTVTKSSAPTKSTTKSKTRSKDRSDTRTSIYRKDGDIIIKVNDDSYDLADITSQCHDAVDKAIKEISWTTPAGEVIYLRIADDITLRDIESELGSLKNLNIKSLEDLEDLGSLKELRKLRQTSESKKSAAKKSGKTSYKSNKSTSGHPTRNSSSFSSSYSI